MPEFSMWGPEAGLAALERKNRSQDIIDRGNLALAQKREQEIAAEQQKAAMQQKLQETFAQMGQAPQQQAQPEQALPQMPKQQAGAPLDTTIARAQKVENTFWQLGMPDKAMEVAKEIGALQTSQASRQAYQATATNQQFERTQKMLQEVDALISSVRPPEQGGAEDWDRMKFIMSAQHPGESNPYANIPYSPQIVEQIRQGTKAGLDKLNAERQLKDTESLIANREEARKFSVDREKRLAEQASERKEEAERKKREGGKEIAQPSEKLIARARGVLHEQYPNLPPKELDQYSFDVASRAKGISTHNHTIDASKALKKAMEESRLRGDIVTVDNLYGHFYKNLTPELMRKILPTPIGAQSYVPGDADETPALTPASYKPVGKYKTPDEVRADYKAGVITKDAAKSTLTQMGFTGG